MVKMVGQTTVLEGMTTKPELVPHKTSALSLNNDSHKSPRKFVSPGSFFISFLFSPGFHLDFGVFLNFGGKDLTRVRTPKSSDKEAVLKRTTTWYLREMAFNSKN